MKRIRLDAMSAVLATLICALPAVSQEPVLMHDYHAEHEPWESSVWSSRLPSCYFGVDSLWLFRNRTDRQVLAVRSTQDVPPVRLDSLNTNAFNFQGEAGLRLMAGMPLDDVVSVEVLYFGLNNWFNRQTLNIDAETNLEERIDSPFLATAIVNGSQQYEYDSMLNNVEANLRSEQPWGEHRTISWLAGFRYLSLNESFAAVNEQAFLVDNMGQLTGQIGDERGRAQTYNNLVGLQLGADVTESFGAMTLGVRGTAGAYANIAKSTYAHRDVVDGVFDPLGSAGVLSRTNTELSGVFTLGLDSVFRISQGISLRFAYEFLLATGMAFAPDQAQPVVANFNPTADRFVTTFAPGDNFDQEGLLFLHGPSVGLFFVW